MVPGAMIILVLNRSNLFVSRVKGFDLHDRE